MTSSSDDSLPLLRRQVAKDILEKKREARKILLGDSSDSSLPSWLEEQNASRQGEGAATSRPAKDKMIFIDSDSSDSDDAPPSQIPKKEEKPQMKREQEAKDHETSTVITDTPGTQQPSQTTVTANKNKDATLKSMVNSNSATIVIPDKLPMEKMIFELESHDSIAGTTDLSGDSGVIGRMLLRKIATAEGGTMESMELDLKGSIYNMTPVRFPGTIMVMNFTGNEAKVEGITDMFIQLREDKRFANDEYAENLKQWLDDDDDDEPVSKKGGSAEPPKNPRGAKQQTRKKQSGGVRKKPAATSRKPGAGRGRKK